MKIKQIIYFCVMYFMAVYVDKNRLNLSSGRLYSNKEVKPVLKTEKRPKKPAKKKVVKEKVVKKEKIEEDSESEMNEEEAKLAA